MRIVPASRAHVHAGQVIGPWTVLGPPFYASVGRGRKFFVAECPRGHIAALDTTERNHLPQCSICRRLETIIKDRLRGMIKRCHNQTDAAYRLYGGRGIYVCDQWRSNPEAFVVWSLANGFHPDLTIDRINGKGPYAPDNCRWAGMDVQGRNRSNNIRIDAFGESMVITDWINDPRCKVSANILKRRLKQGWPIELAMTIRNRRWNKDGPPKHLIKIAN